MFRVQISRKIASVHEIASLSHINFFICADIRIPISRRAAQFECETFHPYFVGEPIFPPDAPLSGKMRFSSCGLKIANAHRFVAIRFANLKPPSARSKSQSLSNLQSFFRKMFKIGDFGEKNENRKKRKNSKSQFHCENQHND